MDAIREKVVCPKCGGWYRIKSGSRNTCSRHVCNDCNYSGRINRGYHVPTDFVFAGNTKRKPESVIKDTWIPVKVVKMSASTFRDTQAATKAQELIKVKRQLARQPDKGYSRHELAHLDRIKGSPLMERDPTYSTRITPEAKKQREMRNKVEDMRTAKELGITYAELIESYNRSE